MARFSVVSIIFETVSKGVVRELGVICEKWLHENKIKAILPPKRAIHSSAAQCQDPQSNWSWHKVEVHGNFGDNNTLYQYVKLLLVLVLSIVFIHLYCFCIQIFATDEFETAKEQCLYFAKHCCFEETTKRGRGLRKKIPREPYTPYEDSSADDLDDLILKPATTSSSEDDGSLTEPPMEPSFLASLENPLDHLVAMGMHKYLNYFSFNKSSKIFR